MSYLRLMLICKTRLFNQRPSRTHCHFARIDHLIFTCKSFHGTPLIAGRRRKKKIRLTSIPVSPGDTMMHSVFDPLFGSSSRCRLMQDLCQCPVVFKLTVLLPLCSLACRYDVDSKSPDLSKHVSTPAVTTAVSADGNEIGSEMMTF